MDKKTRLEIGKVVEQTLRDAGVKGPPVKISQILQHLSLHRDFYDLTNPNFLDKAKHRIKVGGRKLIGLLRRIRLTAVLFGDEKRIIVDKSLPNLKRDFPSFHEVGHKILVWHRPFFYGDTAQTLELDYQEQLEAEANLAASSLMFCGKTFTAEARDTRPQ